MKTLAGANPSLSIINKTKANQENTVIKTKPVVKTGLVRQPKRETKSLLMSMRIRPSTKEKFDKLRKLYRYSQSDFLMHWLRLQKIMLFWTDTKNNLLRISGDALL